MVHIRLILTLCCSFISIAALQAQSLYVGEMSSGGLWMTDIGNKYVVKGIALDFYRRLGSYYGSLEKSDEYHVYYYFPKQEQSSSVINFNIFDGTIVADAVQFVPTKR